MLHDASMRVCVCARVGDVVVRFVWHIHKSDSVARLPSSRRVAECYEPMRARAMAHHQCNRPIIECVAHYSSNLHSNELLWLLYDDGDGIDVLIIGHDCSEPNEMARNCRVWQSLINVNITLLAICHHNCFIRFILGCCSTLCMSNMCPRQRPSAEYLIGKHYQIQFACACVFFFYSNGHMGKPEQKQYHNTDFGRLGVSVSVQ